MLRLDTLRSQMLVGFLLVLVVILTVVGAVTFDSVSMLLKNNAEKHIRQTAVQGNGRLEAILKQVDSLSIQVATHSYVQQLLEHEFAGEESSFAARQALQPVANLIQTYASGITSVEIYTLHGRRLFPLDGSDLHDIIESDSIMKAQSYKGSMLWAGMTPESPGTVTALRRINLINESFAPAGYLLVRIDRNVFKLDELGEGEMSLLVDGSGEPIARQGAEGLSAETIGSLLASGEHTVTIGERSYVLVKQQSPVTGWTLLILTPVSAITEGISVLRTAIFVSAGIGTLLFILLSFLLSTVITRPILTLIKTMRSARFGELKTSEQISSTVEINELNHTYNQMVSNMNELIRLVYEKELLQNRTELKALQAQIHPHFLYNTLEALYWSLVEKDEEELAEYVVAMSELFRYTITGLGREEWVTLGEELEHIERYLLIMGMRFGERLTWRIISTPDDTCIKLPKLLIQPLVENAIQHGVENKIGPGTVTVTVMHAPQEGTLSVTVEDDGAGMDEETLDRLRETLAEGRERAEGSSGSGLGIANVERRLRLYYGEHAALHHPLSIVSSRGSGTAVTLSIPVRTEVQEDDAVESDLSRG